MAGDKEDHKQQPEEVAPTTGAEETTPASQTGVAIQINARLIDPESQLPGGQDFQADSSKTNYIIIQLTGLPTIEQQDQLETLGVQVSESIIAAQTLYRG